MSTSPMDAVEALAAILEPEAFDLDQLADEGWREATKQRAIAHAARVITSGWRRVVEDDDTIRTVADSLAGSDGWKILWPGPGEEFEDQLLRYLRVARAVIRALREET